MNRLLLFGLFTAIFVPSGADAITFTQILGLFHVMTGLLLTFTILIFATGAFVYVARLGTWPSHRDSAIKVLEWAVTLLFVLIILLAILRYFQTYTKVMLVILAVIIIFVAVIYIMKAAAAPKEKKPAGKR